jgi:hypothetical protein
LLAGVGLPAGADTASDAAIVQSTLDLDRPVTQNFAAGQFHAYRFTLTGAPLTVSVTGSSADPTLAAYAWNGSDWGLPISQATAPTNSHATRLNVQGAAQTQVQVVVGYAAAAQGTYTITLSGGPGDPTGGVMIPADAVHGTGPFVVTGYARGTIVPGTDPAATARAMIPYQMSLATWYAKMALIANPFKTSNQQVTDLKNIAETPTQNTLFRSIPSVTIEYPATSEWAQFKLAGGITGASFANDANAGMNRNLSYQDWNSRCFSKLDELRRHPGFIAGSCTLPTDIGGSDHYQLQSDLMVWVRPR